MLISVGRPWGLDTILLAGHPMRRRMPAVLPETVLRRLAPAFARRAVMLASSGETRAGGALRSMMERARRSGATDEQVALATGIVLMIHASAGDAAPRTPRD